MNRKLLRRTNSPLIDMTLALLQIAQRVRGHHGASRFLSLPASAVYRTWALTICGIDIPVSTQIGRNLIIYHGFGLVVNDRAIIGDNVVLRQNTTIGSKSNETPAPIIDDRVDIGPNCVILGPIKIGAGAIIGAGSVVVNDVEAGHVVAGNPARIVAR